MKLKHYCFSKWLLVLASIALCNFAFAQRTISGTVPDGETGESLIGVALGIVAWLGMSTLDGVAEISDILNLSGGGKKLLGQLLSVGALTAVALWVWDTASRRATVREE